jgi:hypothetical protein
MSSKELKRLGVLARVEKEALNLVNAAEILGLSGGAIRTRARRGCSIAAWGGSRGAAGRRSFV